MEVWQETLKVALIGTERQAPSFAPCDDAVGRLLAQMDGEERERTLLRASGLLAVYRRAGYRPAQAADGLPAPAEAEERQTVPDAPGQDLMAMLGGEYRDALPEWLEAAAERGWRISEEHLVELLDYGRGHPESRALLLPLLGKRGRWLAAQNPDWKYALQVSLFEIENTMRTETDGPEDAQQLWQTETKEARIALLHRLRRSAPAAARALVESTWKQDPSAERAEFLSAFTTGLSMEDEPFLENALDDKRKEVRVAAQELLTHLPESRLCLRMWERVRPLVQLQKIESDGAASSSAAGDGLLNRLRSLVAPQTSSASKAMITVELPQACDKAMIRDGIEAKPTNSSIGERTWWLMQMLTRVPLSLWSQEWGADPAAIVAANRSEEWKNTLLQGWTGALRQNSDTEWAIALFRAWIEEGEKMPLDRVWKETLPPDVFEEGLLSLLSRPDQRIQYGNPAFTLLLQQNAEWSDRLTRAVLSRLTDFTGNAYYIAGSLGAYAPSVPMPFRAEFFALWSKLAANNTYIQGQIGRHVALNTFRIEMRRKIDAAAHQEN